MSIIKIEDVNVKKIQTKSGPHWVIYATSTQGEVYRHHTRIKVNSYDGAKEEAWQLAEHAFRHGEIDTRMFACVGTVH